MCDVSTVPDQLSVACTPASSVLQVATDDNRTSTVENSGSDACGAAKQDHSLNAFAADAWLPGTRLNPHRGVLTTQFE